MCLHIFPKLHPKNKVRVAERDIVVYKVLEAASSRTAISPYMEHVWWFGKACFADMIVVKQYYGYIIEEGLHACTTIKSAHTHLWTKCAVYPAVIPKGSEMYFGMDDEVVSNALIVYKNLSDLEKVHGKVAEPVLKREISAPK